MKVVVLASAVGDLRSARRFYARQGGRQLGERFLDVLSGTISGLSESAGLHARHWGLYRALSPRFPYSVYYDIAGGVVRVHAVLDNRRNPETLAARLLRTPHS